MLNGLKQFKNPPIKEAIFAISFKEVIPQESLNLFIKNEFIKKNFPIYQPGIVVEVTNKQKPNQTETDITKAVSTNHKQEGYLLRGEDGSNRLVQINPTSLSYHTFNKYTGWESMFNELQKIWVEFCKSVSKTMISQISVRYINHIRLPFPLKNGIQNYIKLLPQIPDGINPKLNNFFIQIHVPNGKNSFQGVITETLLSTDSKKEMLIVLLDISVVEQKDFNCDEQAIWTTFNQIREFKNELFSSCITEETKELFN